MGPKYAWKVNGDKIKFDIASENPIHPNNANYARLDVEGGITNLINNGGNAFVNSGYDGIAVKKGEPYRFRMKAAAGRQCPST